MPKLTDRVAGDADTLYEHFTAWAEGEGIQLYPHQDEAAIELFSGNNLILATPTGSGKSMVALAAHFAALATDRVSFYTAPIKALVSEKFFDLVDILGRENVGDEEIGTLARNLTEEQVGSFLEESAGLTSWVADAAKKIWEAKHGQDR